MKRYKLVITDHSEILGQDWETWTDAEMVEHPDGPYVLFADVLKLQLAERRRDSGIDERKFN